MQFYDSLRINYDKHNTDNNSAQELNLVREEVIHTSNERIRTAITQNNLHNWEVADALGVHESTFCKRLRHELPEAEQEHVLDIIEKLGAKNDE